jgi:hypothetical protein
MRRAVWLFPVAAVLIVAAIPLGMRYARLRREAAEETSVIASLVVLLSAQATFHKTDYYGKGDLRYANTIDGRGIRDLHEMRDADGNTRKVNLLDAAFVDAFERGEARGNYRWIEVIGDEDGPFDPRTECAVCAYPVEAHADRPTFIMDRSGSIWKKLNGGKPVTILPKDLEAEGWVTLSPGG